MRSAFILSTLLVGAQTSLAARSEGCGKALPQGLTQGAAGKSNAMTFGTSDSATRRYLLHIPEHYDKDKPTGLIWSFAGRGKDAEHQEKLTQLSDPSYNRDHIVVYPQADTNGTTQDTDTEEKAKAGPTHVLRRSKHDDDSDPDEDDDESDDWQYEDGDSSSSSSSKGSKKGKTQSQWQGDPDSTANDVQFTLELLDRISATFCIDTDRVFASGLSNGGGFVANVLACDAVASTRFAAFAAASGAYYQNDVKGGKKNCHADTVPITCDNNGTRVPLIFTHGGADKTISYEGGARRKSCLPSVPHFVTAWAERDGLAAKNDSSEVQGTDITHYSFGSGAEQGFVQSYYLPDLGHKWPSQDESNFSATRTFVDFFERWNMTARLAAVEAAGDGGSKGGKGGGDGSSSSSKKSSATPRLQSGAVSTAVLAVAMAASFALF